MLAADHWFQEAPLTIKHVQVRNYRSIENASVDLDRPTVLVGRNGSGKSAFVDVLRFVRDTVRDGLDRALTERQGYEAVRRWSRTKSHDVEIALTRNNGDQYGFALASSDGRAVVREEHYRSPAMTFERNRGLVKIRSKPRGQSEHREEIRFDQSELYLSHSTRALTLGQMFFCNAFPNTLRIPQPPGDHRRLMDTGGNLASVLQRLGADGRKRDSIIAALRELMPEIVDFAVERVGGWLSLRLYHSDPSGGPPIGRDAAAESDGTLRLLSLVTALLASDAPSLRGLIAIEEPELGVHPGVLADVWALIERVADKRTVLVTTHSPDLISRAPMRCLRVVRIRDGVTTISRLAKEQVAAVQQELFTTGDLLRIRDLEPEHSDAAGTADG